MEQQRVMLKIRYNMSDTLSLPDDEYETITVAMPTRTEDGLVNRVYTNLRDKMKSIDIYSIDSDGNLLDKDNNVIMEPDSIDPVPLQISNQKIFSATWLQEE